MKALDIKEESEYVIIILIHRSINISVFGTGRVKTNIVGTNKERVNFMTLFGEISIKHVWKCINNMTIVGFQLRPPPHDNNTDRWICH